MALFLEQTATHIRQYTNHNVLLLEHIVLARYCHPTLNPPLHILHIRQPGGHASFPHSKNHQSGGRQQVVKQLACGRVAARTDAVLHDTALYSSRHRPTSTPTPSHSIQSKPTVDSAPAPPRPRSYASAALRTRTCFRTRTRA